VPTGSKGGTASRDNNAAGCAFLVYHAAPAKSRGGAVDSAAAPRLFENPASRQAALAYDAGREAGFRPDPVPMGHMSPGGAFSQPPAAPPGAAFFRRIDAVIEIKNTPARAGAFLEKRYNTAFCFNALFTP